MHFDTGLERELHLRKKFDERGPRSSENANARASETDDGRERERNRKKMFCQSKKFKVHTCVLHIHICTYIHTSRENLAESRLLRRVACTHTLPLSFPLAVAILLSHRSKHASHCPTKYSKQSQGYVLGMYIHTHIYTYLLRTYKHSSLSCTLLCAILLHFFFSLAKKLKTFQLHFPKYLDVHITA